MSQMTYPAQDEICTGFVAEESQSLIGRGALGNILTEEDKLRATINTQRLLLQGVSNFLHRFSNAQAAWKDYDKASAEAHALYVKVNAQLTEGKTLARTSR